MLHSGSVLQPKFPSREDSKKAKRKERNSNLRNLLSRILRALFIRTTLRNLHFQDNHLRIKALYTAPDPWNLTSEKEQYRFDATNRAILEFIGPVESLLELGCGEGHQSSSFLNVSKSLTGIDISQLAISRAIKRCPTAQFLVSESGLSELGTDSRYDLATACEVLYYVKDVASILNQMQSISEWCLVTYYTRHAAALDPYFREKQGIMSLTIHHDDTTWQLHCWRSREPNGPDPNRDLP
jgi:hypothetical protein